MLSHTKALLALSMAFVGVIVTWFWFQDRSSALARMRRERTAIQSQIADAASYAPVVADLGKRVQVLEAEKKEAMNGFLPANNEGPRLIQAVVDSATACSIRMTSASETQAKGRAKRNDIPGIATSTVSYSFSLRGPYIGLVKFFQAMKKWPFNSRVESVDIVSQGDRNSDADLQIALVITVFSISE